MLLTIDFSQEGVNAFMDEFSALIASASAAELSALQSALDSFLADIDVLGSYVAQNAATLVPWIAAASLAAMGAGEIVRRDLKRKQMELRRAVAFA